MRIGIYGGAFDPPHNAHLRVAKTVKKALALDAIRFVPTKVPAHKSPSKATEKQRVEMLERMINETDSFVVDEVELKRSGTSYTVDTIEFYKASEPDNEFYLIIGGDMVEYLPKWHKIDKLSKMVNIVGVSRPGYKIQSEYPITFVEIEELDIASSVIREKIANGMNVSKELPENVLRYIKENRLYENN